MSESRVGLIAEDTRFVDFLLLAIASVADTVGVRVRLDPVEKTRGCHPERLRHLVMKIRPQVDLVTVGVDSGSRSSRQKRRGLIAKLGSTLDGAVLAIAAPCVEAWLLAEPTAFRDGIEAGLHLQFQMPEQWPVFRSERQTKDALGSILTRGIDGVLPRFGVEYADHIVSNMNLRDWPNESLRAWVRELEGRLRQAG